MNRLLCKLTLSIYLRDETDFSPRGALKANIGHLEGAAGLAGIIKAVLVLERGVIPPIAALAELNMAIDSEFMKLEVNQTGIHES